MDNSNLNWEFSTASGGTTGFVTPLHSCTGYPCQICYPAWAPLPQPYQWPTITYWPAPVRAPHRCPVCEGRGTVGAGFYSGMGALADAGPVQCRSCSGQGLVWG